MSSPDLSSKDYLLKSYTYWDLALHENQCYLGRVYVMLKSCEGVEDFLSIKGDVRDELFMIGEKIKDVLKILFSPDKFNIASLSNSCPLIHVHIIPRYETPRTFESIEFKDTRWGQNYAPYDKSFSMPTEVFLKLRDLLREKL